MFDFLKRFSPNSLNKIGKESILKAIVKQKEISEWRGNQESKLVSLGENCNSAWYLKESNNKEASYPFDWIFSSAEIVLHTISDNFSSFMNREQIISLGKKAGHKTYHNSLFNHRNPLSSDENYSYYKRAVDRFIGLINSGEQVIFVITVINEFKKRKGWYNGFTESMTPSFPQGLDSFSDLMLLLRSKNNKARFMFIEQYTECDMEIDISIKTDEVLWIKFSSFNKNTGVYYTDALDDIIMKILYSGLAR